MWSERVDCWWHPWPWEFMGSSTLGYDDEQSLYAMKLLSSSLQSLFMMLDLSFFFSLFEHGVYLPKIVERVQCQMWCNMSILVTSELFLSRLAV